MPKLNFYNTKMAQVPLIFETQNNFGTKIIFRKISSVRHPQTLALIGPNLECEWILT